MHYDPLDDSFPLGDGVADTEATVQCPYCAQNVVIALDPSDAPIADYIEDCQVCCQPWAVHVVFHRNGHAEVTVGTLDG